VLTTRPYNDQAVVKYFPDLGQYVCSTGWPAFLARSTNLSKSLDSTACAFKIPTETKRNKNAFLLICLS